MVHLQSKSTLSSSFIGYLSMSYRALIYCSLFIFTLASCASNSYTSNNVHFTDNSGGYGFCKDGTRLKILKIVPPQYPPDLLQKGIEGFVSVRFSIKPDGTTSNIKIENSTVDLFNDSVIVAVSQWRFEPYDAKIPPLIHEFPINFSLKRP